MSEAGRHEPAEVRVVGPPLTHYANITLVVLGVLAVLGALWLARSVCVAVFLGLFLAAGLDPLVRRVQRMGLRRGWAVLVVVLVLLALIAGILLVALRPAVTELSALTREIPGLIDKMSSSDNPLGAYLHRADVQQELENFLHRLPGLISGSADRVLGAIGSLMSGLVIGGTALVLMIYFLLAWPRMLAWAERMLADPERVSVAHEALGKIGGYVTGQICVSTLAGLAAYIFFKLTGVPYPSLLAVVVGVCDFIPQIGATIGAVIGTVVALSQSVGLAVATLVFFLIYQHVENYLIAPRVFAKAVALSPVAAFLSALFGVAIGGFIGAVVALPCVAALKVVLRYALGDRLAIKT